MGGDASDVVVADDDGGGDDLRLSQLEKSQPMTPMKSVR